MNRTHLVLMLVRSRRASRLQQRKPHDRRRSTGRQSIQQGCNANVQLPPSIVATKLYRCDDNSVVTVDYLSDNQSANVHLEKGGAVTKVTTAKSGKPMTAEGEFSVQGSPTSSSATIAVPGHPSQTCNA